MRIIRTQNGISIILAVIALMMLSALGLGIMSMTVIESRTVINYNDHVYAIYLAEAGIERGIAAIKSSVPGGGVTRDSAADAYYQHDHSYGKDIDKNNPNKLWELEETGSCLAGDSKWGAGNWGSDQYTFALSGRKGVTLRGFIDFDDAVLRNSALTGPVSVVIRNRWKNGTPHMYVSWCNDNDDPCQNRSNYTTLFNVEYSNSSVTPKDSWELYSAELCAGSCAGWTWDDLSNLYVRITNNHDSKGSSKDDDLDIDHVYIRFPRPVDNSMGTLLSNWTWNDTTGSYQSGLLNLGRGTVETEIVAPSSGVNVNYANQRMLEQLFDECNLGSLSDNVAEDLIAWRSSNGPFTSNGQVRQVLTNDYGYSDETVDKFIDYIAVLSYVDSQVYKNDNDNPHDSGFVTRAPININTAPELVIRAALDGIAHVEHGNAEDLARDIVAHRESVGPFTSISSTAEEINSLLNFVWGKRFAGSYSSFLKSDVGFINDNADPSWRDHYANQTDDENTTEFTVSSTSAPYNSFIITSTGTVGDISRTVTRTVHIDSSGNIKFDVPLPEGGTANSWEAVVEN